MRCPRHMLLTCLTLRCALPCTMRLCRTWSRASLVPFKTLQISGAEGSGFALLDVFDLVALDKSFAAKAPSETEVANDLVQLILHKRPNEFQRSAELRMHVWSMSAMAILADRSDGKAQGLASGQISHVMCLMQRCAMLPQCARSMGSGPACCDAALMGLLSKEFHCMHDYSMAVLNLLQAQPSHSITAIMSVVL